MGLPETARHLNPGDAKPLTVDDAPEAVRVLAPYYRDGGGGTIDVRGQQAEVYAYSFRVPDMPPRAVAMHKRLMATKRDGGQFYDIMEAIRETHGATP